MQIPRQWLAWASMVRSEQCRAGRKGGRPRALEAILEGVRHPVLVQGSTRQKQPRFAAAGGAVMKALSHVKQPLVGGAQGWNCNKDEGGGKSQQQASSRRGTR